MKAAAALAAVLAVVNQSLALALDPILPFQNQSGPSNPFNVQPKQGQAIQYQRQPGLSEMIQRQAIPTTFVQPVPLKGVHIRGLTAKSIDMLGYNYFVVSSNTQFTKMSDVYRDTRLQGKSNFVTADSIVHPYLAFTNRIIADVAVNQLLPDLQILLDGMLKSALTDYKEAQDADVRSDIERNIAYTVIGLKLVKPTQEIPEIGEVPKMIATDWPLVMSGRRGHSLIFDRDVDFSSMQPIGWYRSSEKLQNFRRSYNWLSQMAYPIDDTSGSDGHSANSFRRSVLLFRALDQSRVLGKPGLDSWIRLTGAITLLGTRLENASRRTLYPIDYKPVFSQDRQTLQVTLEALAEPLFRTKLMLAIKRQKPMNLDSASIFDLEESDNAASGGEFRLFPIIGEPELPWLHSVAQVYPDDKEQAPVAWPIALMDLYVWGSAQAGNVLADNLDMLDPRVAKSLPELQHCVLHRNATGQLVQVDSRAWRIMTNYFRPVPDGPPAVLRTNYWFTHRLESAIGGWLDSVCAIAPPDTAKPRAAAASPTVTTGSTGSTTVSSIGMSRTVTAAAPASTPGTSPNDASVGPNATAVGDTTVRRKGNTYHYLEPVPDVYRAIELDAQNLTNRLSQLHYLPDNCRAHIADFIRLAQRLQKIAGAELRLTPLTSVDQNLLANFDAVLEKVDVPLPAVLTIGPNGGPKTTPMFSAPARKTAPQTPPEPPSSKGFNLALGRPGVLHIIYQNPRTMEWTLGRGAVYTYYEAPAPLMTEAMWNHRLDTNFVHPLTWTEKFDVIQPTNDTHTKTASTQP